MSTLNVNMNDVESLDIELELGTIINVGDFPIYEGSYNVTPKVSEQVLETKNKSLLDDITVFEIPYASVSNPSGGQTVTIG